MERDEELKIYYDHYKETYGIIVKTIAERNKYFVQSALLLCVSVFFFYDPATCVKIVQDLFKVCKKVNLKTLFNAFNTIVIIVSTWYWLQYFQKVIYLENLYNYIHKMEETLTKKMEFFKISREGKTYLKFYPALKDLIHWTYILIIPLSLMLLAIIKIFYEITSPLTPNTLKIVNVLCMSCFIIMTVLYLSWIHCKDKWKNYFFNSVVEENS